MYTTASQLGTSTHIAQVLGEMPHQVNEQEGAPSHQINQGEIFSQASPILQGFLFSFQPTHLC